MGVSVRDAYPDESLTRKAGEVMTNGRIVQSAYDVNRKLVDLRYYEFGKGKAKIKQWKIFRDGVEVGYGAVESDALANFQRVRDGATLNRETGRYEHIETCNGGQCGNPVVGTFGGLGMCRSHLNAANWAAGKSRYRR